MVSGTESQGSLLGDFFALVMAVSYAGAIVTSRRYPEIGMMPAACLGAACAMLVSLPFAAPLAVSSHDLPIMLLFGAGQLGGAMALFVTGVRLIPAATSALLAMIEPILGPVWVWLALGEKPAPTVLVGGAIVILSVAAKTILDGRQAIPEPPAV
jgi:drug/metabolite transporter (DMT)-like permease